MGAFVPIAELLVSLKLESASLRAGLATARAALISFANETGQQSAQLERLKVQIGQVMKIDRDMVNNRIAGLRTASAAQKGATGQFINLLSEQQAAILLLDKAKREAAEREKALVLETLAVRKREALEVRALEQNKALNARVSARSRLEMEKATVAGILAARRLERTQAIALEKNKTLNAQVEAKKRQEAEQIAIAAALQTRKLAAVQAIAIDQNRTRIAVANRRAETAATIQSAAIQKQVVRGLVLSSFLVAGRAGLVTGLIGVAGAATVATAGIVLGLGAVIKEGVQFDNALIRSTSNIKGMTDALRDDLGEAAVALSNEFPISARKIVESLEQTRQSGLDAQQVMASWPDFVKFSIAANADLGESIKTLVAIQRGFSTEFDIKDEKERIQNIKDISNLILAAAQQGGQSGLELAKGLAAAGSAADKTGNSFKQVVAGLTILGIKNFDGSRSGEILAQIMQRLRDEAVQNTEAWNRLVPSLSASSDTSKDFSKVMSELAKVIGTTDTRLNAYNSVQLGLEARTSKFVAVLLKEGATMEDLIKAFEEFSGITVLLDAKMDNLTDQATILFNRLLNLSRIGFGDTLAKPFRVAVDAANEYLDIVETVRQRDKDLFEDPFETLTRNPRRALEAIGLGGIIFPNKPPPSPEPTGIGFAEDLTGRRSAAGEIFGLSAFDLESRDRLLQKFNSKRRNELDALSEDQAELNRLVEEGAFTASQIAAVQLDINRKRAALIARIRKDEEAILTAQESENRIADIAISKRDREDVRRFKAMLDIKREQEDLERRASKTFLSDAIVDRAIKEQNALEKAAEARSLRDTKVDVAIRKQNIEILKRGDLEQKLEILRDQALEGQANKFAIMIARINAQAAKQNQRLEILYDQDEKNFANLQEAKVLLFEIAGQRQRQVINRIGNDLEAMFDRNILDAESFSDALANIFGDIAGHFKTMVFQMLAAWIAGQSELVNSTKQSGGFGGVIGILTSVLGGFLGGGTTSAGLRPPVPFIRAPIGTTLNLDSGGSFRGGQPFVSGVPELIIPSVSGSAVPLDVLRGPTINNFIDARGADVATVSRITRAIERIEKDSNKNAVITTREMALRGFRV